MWGLFVSASIAATPPAIMVQDDGTVVGVVTIAASEASIRAMISDPVKMSSMDPTTKVEVSPDGNCKLIANVISHPVAEVTYTSRACPTATGITYTLVESDDFKRFASAWEIQPAGEGQFTLRYSVLTVPSFPIPQWVISRQTSQSVSAFLTKLSGQLERGR